MTEAGRPHWINDSGRAYVECTNGRLWSVKECNATNYIILGRGSAVTDNAPPQTPPRTDNNYKKNESVTNDLEELA